MGNYNAKRNEMAKYAYREICLYQKLAEINKFDINAICLDDEWEEVPLCSKQKLHMNLANMLNPRYILLENSSQMQHVFTSGTSGQCLEVLASGGYKKITFASLAEKNEAIWYSSTGLFMYFLFC